MELRWVLLGLGALLIGGIYLWGQGVIRYRRRDAQRPERAEPAIDADESEVDDEPVEVTGDDFRSTVIERKPSPRAPEKVIALRLIPRGEELPTGEQTVLAMRKLGLEHGKYGIFHRIVDGNADSPEFSIARLTQPGSFDLTELATTRIPGLSVFMMLPGRGDPVERFDRMLETSRALARELDAELFDEKGSSWSVQRERFVREEVIQYRHHFDHG